MSIDNDDLNKMFERFAEPKQILFLSADLVGSTALKQKKRKPAANKVHHPDTQEWASTIQFFFSNFGTCFDATWTERADKIRSVRDQKLVETRLGSKPILWKMIGDELVYRKYISHRHQVKETIDIWINSIKLLYENFVSILGNPEISIKCTAWLGEFPIQNKILVGSQFSGKPGSLPLGPGGRLAALKNYETEPVKDGIEIDFIGPAIDIGFRLTKKATPRKFILSIDTIFLYVLSEMSGKLASSEDDDGTSKATKIHYSGAETLPGVFGGLPYPLFWIDMIEHNSSEILTDNFLKLAPIEKRDDILKYCKEFYKEQKSYVDRPYIATDKTVNVMQISTVPDWYDEEKLKLRDDMLGSSF